MQKLIVVGILGIFSISFFYFFLSLRYDLGEVANSSDLPVCYDINGVKLPASLRSKSVSFQEIPPFLIQALQAREDARFFQHHGVDLLGLARSSLKNLSDQRFTQGGSTLTMQLARNAFLPRDKSLHRKLLEMTLALRIENQYSKEEILSSYLGRVYFGSGAQGLGQAAQIYFAKNIADLSDAESALLVGIIRGPHLYSPLTNLPGAIQQQKQTLDRMLSLDLIDSARSETITRQPIVLATAQQRSTQISYIHQAIQREIRRTLGYEISLAGLRVYTTLDLVQQHRLEARVFQTVKQIENQPDWPYATPQHYVLGEAPDYLQCAAVTMDVQTGGVLAMIGGRDFSHSPFEHTRASRELGPAFQPFIAAATAENGKSIFPDQPLITGRQIGPEETINIARRFGFSGPFGEEEDVFRGHVSSSTLELSVALGALSNNGKRSESHLIREIRDISGKLLYSANPTWDQAVCATAAKKAVAPFCQKNSDFALNSTTSSGRDAWMMNSNEDICLVIWLGFDQPSAIGKADRIKSLLQKNLEPLK